MAFSATTQADDVPGYYMVDLLRDKYGYEVDAQRIESNAAQPAFISGQVNFVEQSAKIAIGYAQAGEDLTCFATHDFVVAYMPVANGASTPEELPETPTIAVSQDNSLDAIVWDVVREGYGYPPESEKVIVGGQSARLAALAAGQVDVAVLGIANALSAEQQGDLHVLREYADFVPQAANELFCARADWIADTPGADQTLVDFAKASIEAARWFYDSPEEWAERLLLEVPEFDPNLIDGYHELLAAAEVYKVNGGITDTAALEDAIRLAVDSGDIPEPLEVSFFADASYTERALEDLGER